MRTTCVVPIDPLGNCAPCFLKTGKIVLPNAFFLQAPKETFYDAILLRRVRRDKLLRKFVVPACFPKASALEHKTVITTDDRHSFVRMQRAKTFDAGIFKRPFCLPGPSSKSKFKADQLTIAAVYDSDEVSPTVNSAGDMRDVCCPSRISHYCLTAASLYPWLGVDLSVPDLPAVAC